MSKALTVEDYLPKPGEEPRSGWEVLAARRALDGDPQGLTVYELDSVGDALAKAFKAGRAYQADMFENRHLCGTEAEGTLVKIRRMIAAPEDCDEATLLEALKEMIGP